MSVLMGRVIEEKAVRSAKRLASSRQADNCMTVPTVMAANSTRRRRQNRVIKVSPFLWPEQLRPASGGGYVSSSNHRLGR